MFSCVYHKVFLDDFGIINNAFNNLVHAKHVLSANQDNQVTKLTKDFINF